MSDSALPSSSASTAGMLPERYINHRNSKIPILPTVKAVYCRDFSDIFTCQNLDFKSIIEKNRAPTKDSMVSCIWGRGYESFLVLAFYHWKSIQNRKPPSFFRTRTTALHQADCKGRMAPPSSISWRCSRTSSKSGRAIRHNLSLKGSSSSNSIMCSAASVHISRSCPGKRCRGIPLIVAQISGLAPQSNLPADLACHPAVATP